MTTKYRIVPIVFSAKKWAALMRSIPDDAIGLWADAMGVTVSTVLTWRHLEKRPDCPHPSMKSFLAAINAFDITAQDFFVLDESEGL